MSQLAYTIKPGTQEKLRSEAFVGKDSLTVTMFAEGKFDPRSVGTVKIIEAPGMPTVNRIVGTMGCTPAVNRKGGTAPGLTFTVGNPNPKALGASCNIEVGKPFVVVVSNIDWDGPCDVLVDVTAPQAAK